MCAKRKGWGNRHERKNSYKKTTPTNQTTSQKVSLHKTRRRQLISWGSCMTTWVGQEQRGPGNYPKGSRALQVNTPSSWNRAKKPHGSERPKTGQKTANRIAGWTKSLKRRGKKTSRKGIRLWGKHHYGKTRGRENQTSE